MKVLGIDCGAERTGYGVIESDGRVHRLLGCGAIVTSPREAFEARLLKIANGLREQIAEHRPHAAVIEEVFYAVNAKTALRLSHVRGVAMLAVAESGIPLSEYSALEVKMAVVGYGRAEKQQVQQMVASLLMLAAAPESADASDALAIAICHANRSAVPAA